MEEIINSNLNSKIEFFNKKFTLYNFLCQIKKRNDKKYSIINKYYFLIKTCFKKIKRNVANKRKIENMNKLKVFFDYSTNVRTFYSKCKIYSTNNKFMKEKQGQKLCIIKEFYNNKLRSKILKVLKEIKLAKKKYEQDHSSLLMMYVNFLKKSLIKKIRSFYKIKFIDKKNLIFYFRLTINKLKNNFNQENKNSENDRKIRKFKFLNKSKLFYQQIKLIKHKFTIAQHKIYHNTIFFFYHKFIIATNMMKLTSKISRKQLKSFMNLKVQLFLKRTHKIIQTDKERFHKLSYISNLWNKLVKHKTLLLFQELYRNEESSEKEKTRSFYYKIYLKLLLISFRKNERIFESIQKFKKTFPYNTIKQNLFGKFMNQINIIHMRVKNINISIYYRHHILKRIFFSKFVEISSILLIRRDKYITALLNFRRVYNLKTFKGLKLNSYIKKQKKEEFRLLKESREKIIGNHLLEKLLINCSKELNKREEIIANVYIKRSSKGIQTALQWIKKLRNRITIKKMKSQINSPKVKLKVNQFLNNEINLEYINKLQEDINILINLKNKKRFVPQKLVI